MALNDSRPYDIHGVWPMASLMALCRYAVTVLRDINMLCGRRARVMVMGDVVTPCR